MKRVALVTGGTRGLGAAMALALQAAGYAVAAVYRHNATAAIVFQEATAIPAFCWDAADYAACKTGIKKIESELGGIDVLVNNAGISCDQMLHDMAPEQWWEVVNTNLGSVFNMCRHVIGGMRERQFGRIINISSLNARYGQEGQTADAASKAGILGLTRSLALENAGKNITVNAIAPGYCDTEAVTMLPKQTLKRIVTQIPAGRLGTGQDIARLALLLAHDDAGFITGATFDINGGQAMS